MYRQRKAKYREETEVVFERWKHCMDDGSVLGWQSKCKRIDLSAFTHLDD